MGSKTEFISPEGLRIDGRKVSEIRKIGIRTSISPTSDGSVCLSVGKSTVIVHVEGPKDPAKSKHRGADASDPSSGHTLTASAESERLMSIHAGHHGRCGINVIMNIPLYSENSIASSERFDPNTGKIAKSAKSKKVLAEYKTNLESALANLIMLHNYPHSIIDIIVFVVSSDGGLLAALINACTLALIDAGIAINDYLTSTTIAILPNQNKRVACMTSAQKKLLKGSMGATSVTGEKSSTTAAAAAAAAAEGGKTSSFMTCLLDPTQEELNAARGVFTLSYLNKSAKIAHVFSSGRIPILDTLTQKASIDIDAQDPLDVPATYANISALAIRGAKEIKEIFDLYTRKRAVTSYL